KSVIIWIPVPRSDSWQGISDVSVSCAYPFSFHTDPEYGNTILKIAATDHLTRDLSASMNFRVTRFGYRMLDQENTRRDTTSAAILNRFLLADHLVPIDGKIAEEAKTVIRRDMSELKKARSLYDHIVATMTYDKTGTGWGNGDALYACDIRRGNCTDFHSLFIGLARASSIPSRFIMGFPIPPGVVQGEISGYHCWAEFYIEGIGWIPIDASEAKRHTKQQDFFFGGLDENRVQFSIGRDIPIDPALGEKPLNYFIYPYVEIDGHKSEEVEFKLRFKETTM
ncbi:MAG: transglutaminase domain-containing protein, partial [Ignavibacteriae bacterium]|nr:transglutaminase domain-containing protein [Ignavibacteriota bacterium]